MCGHGDDIAGETCGTSPAASRLVNLAFAFWSSRMLLCADEVGIFTALAREPADSAALSSRLGLRHEAATEFLCALVELGLLEYQDGLYRNMNEGAAFLDSADPRYIGCWLAMARAALSESLDLAACLRQQAVGCDANTLSLKERMWADLGDVLRTTGL